MSIFIADDSAMFRKIIEKYVAELKYGTTESFNSGEALLERLQGYQPRAVRAIVLDIFMPGMGGIECCLRIRALPGYADIPLLLVTAFDDEVHMLCGFEAGATDYIKKPIQKYDLQVRLRTSIQLHEERQRRREYELRLMEDVIVAQEVQGRLLTTHVDAKSFRMDLLYRPAATISGDMVYVCPTGPGRYAALLLDVMGHGVSSAFIAILLQSAAREMFLQHADPGTVLTALARQMWDLATVQRPETVVDTGQVPSFFSAVCFDFDLPNHCLRWVNAGHVPILLKQAECDMICMESESPPLGLMPDMQLRTREMSLPAECRLLAFSDGILDNYFVTAQKGLRYLEQCLASSSAASPAAFLAELRAGLVPERVATDMDDLCVMAIDISL